jgi:hypothetical protein
MSVESLLDALMVPSIPPIELNEGTLDSVLTKDGSLSSLGSPSNGTTLDDALGIATNGLPITPLEVHDALSLENIEEWQSGEIDTDILAGFAQLFVRRREMDKGIVPDHFTEHASCKQCGPVWLPTSQNVLGCPWCFNGAAGRPIPRPCSVRCAECVNFERIAHPHLGHCAKGKPEGIVGLWDADKRFCNQYSPSPIPTNNDHR